MARVAGQVLTAERSTLAALSIAFVGPAAIRSLNREFFGNDALTDVIAFKLGGAVGQWGGGAVGDIYICPQVAARNAKLEGISLRDELRRLVVHGVLHVLGYDHPAGSAARLKSPMWKRQERHLAALR